MDTFATSISFGCRGGNTAIYRNCYQEGRLNLEDPTAGWRRILGNQMVPMMISEFDDKNIDHEEDLKE